MDVSAKYIVTIMPDRKVIIFLSEHAGETGVIFEVIFSL